MHGLASAVIGVFTAAGGGRGQGPALLFSGMFAGAARSDWPSGVQEADAPRFAVEHAASLRPGEPPEPVDRPSATAEDEVAGEIIDLFNRPLDSSIRGWLGR